MVHKHGVGGCEGTLVATLDGLRYETTNKGDAFTCRTPRSRPFAVDYLEKNLRVKQKGGKTWNFTDKTATTPTRCSCSTATSRRRERSSPKATPASSKRVDPDGSPANSDFSAFAALCSP